MRHMLRPNVVIVCAATLALVLAGCDVNIEPTDLSAVTIENDRAVIEKTLGKPVKVVDAEGFTVAAYIYDEGYHEQTCRGCGNLRGNAALATPLIALHQYIAARKRAPKSKLAAVYDTGEKLVFVGSLAGAVPTSEWLTSIVIRYKATQTGDVDALISLSEIAFIPGQQRTFLQTAAEKGSAEIQYRVSSLVTEDADKIGWLRKAAAQDHIRAQIDLGNILLYGPNEFVDRTEAKVWLTKAAEAGNSADRQQVKLGLSRAAIAGDQDAIESLEKMVSNEDWVHKLRVTAQQGDAVSQRKLGQAYRFGEGIGQNYEEAIRWFERAAIGGDADSQYILGALFEFEDGIETDHIAALKWYTIVETKSSAAKLRKAELSEKLTPAQIAEAERLAREWLEAHPK